MALYLRGQRGPLEKTPKAYAKGAAQHLVVQQIEDDLREKEILAEPVKRKVYTELEKRIAIELRDDSTQTDRAIAAKVDGTAARVGQLRREFGKPSPKHRKRSEKIAKLRGF